ncbi:hypothetical protein PRUPE_8G070700 [Prunus persica]|uniref:Uncharacterized protein n=1 Tax=Prunus persica TaxID=3760 RepID=A0A251MUE1_PRUPE|nr:hypothetical protein PRUPE_8G070700 [Prunus persica]
MHLVVALEFDTRDLWVLNVMHAIFYRVLARAGKSFFIFWKRRQMVRSALGSSSYAERQGDLGKALLGPGEALLSGGCTVKTFRESPHHMPKFRINLVTMVRLVFEKGHDLLPQKSGFGNCQALVPRCTRFGGSVLAEPAWSAQGLAQDGRIGLLPLQLPLSIIQLSREDVVVLFGHVLVQGV